MRKLLIITLFLGFAFQTQGQEKDINKEIEIGTVVEINEPQVYGYKYIQFPRPNFIIKRGGIVNYNSVKGNRVEITGIEIKKDGSREVQLKRINGGKFFRNFTTVKADLDKALESGEIIL